MEPWIALTHADLNFVNLEVGPLAGDVDAGLFWDHPPQWIAAGGTPDEAIDALLSPEARRKWLSRRDRNIAGELVYRNRGWPDVFPGLKCMMSHVGVIQHREIMFQAGELCEVDQWMAVSSKLSDLISTPWQSLSSDIHAPLAAVGETANAAVVNLVAKLQVRWNRGL